MQKEIVSEENRVLQRKKAWSLEGRKKLFRWKETMINAKMELSIKKGNPDQSEDGCMEILKME